MTPHEWLTGHPKGRTTAEYASEFGVSIDAAGHRFTTARHAGHIVLVGRGRLSRWGLPEHAEGLRAAYEAHKAQVQMGKQSRHNERMRVLRKSKPKPFRSRDCPRVSSIWQLAERMAA